MTELAEVGAPVFHHRMIGDIVGHIMAGDTGNHTLLQPDKAGFPEVLEGNVFFFLAAGRIFPGNRMERARVDHAIFRTGNVLGIILLPVMTVDTSLRILRFHQEFIMSHLPGMQRIRTHQHHSGYCQ